MLGVKRDAPRYLLSISQNPSSITFPPKPQVAEFASRQELPARGNCDVHKGRCPQDTLVLPSTAACFVASGQLLGPLHCTALTYQLLILFSFFLPATTTRRSALLLPVSSYPSSVHVKLAKISLFRINFIFGEERCCIFSGSLSWTSLFGTCWIWMWGSHLSRGSLRGLERSRYCSNISRGQL